MASLPAVEIKFLFEAAPIKRKGFGKPLILGDGGAYARAILLAGQASIRWIDSVRGKTQFVDVVYVVSGTNTPLTVARSGAGTEGDHYVITVGVATNGSGNPTTQAKEIVRLIELEQARLQIESGDSGIVWQTKDRSKFIEVVYTDPGGTEPLAVTLTGTGTEADPFLIDVQLETAGSGPITSATQLKGFIEGDSSAVLVDALVSLTLTGNGSVDVSAFSQAPLVREVNAATRAQLVTTPGVGLVTAVSLTALALPVDAYAEFLDITDAIAEGYQPGDPEYDIISVMSRQARTPQIIAVFPRPAGTSITSALDTLIGSHSDWYFLLIGERDKASIHEAGEWLAVNKRLGAFATTDLTIGVDRDNAREHLMAHTFPENYPDAALAANNLPLDPGSVDWNLTVLAGQKDNAFTPTILLALQAANVGSVQEQFGTIVAIGGNGSSGLPLDVTRGADFIEARIRENLFVLSTRNPKISFDSDGIPLIESELQSVMDEASGQGIVASVEPGNDADLANSDDGLFQFKIFVPTRSEVSQADRTDRKLTGIEITYFLAGSIRTIEMTIRVVA